MGLAPGGRGVVKGLGSEGNLTFWAPILDRGVTLSTLSRALSIDVPLLRVSNMSLKVDLSTLRPKPAGVVGGTESKTVSGGRNKFSLNLHFHNPKCEVVDTSVSKLRVEAAS